MFVIVQSWENVVEETKDQDLDLHEKIGRMLGHAGVSITVTSFTDILAFAVGASTVSFHSNHLAIIRNSIT